MKWYEDGVYFGGGDGDGLDRNCLNYCAFLKRNLWLKNLKLLKLMKMKR